MRAGGVDITHVVTLHIDTGPARTGNQRGLIKRSSMNYRIIPVTAFSQNQPINLVRTKPGWRRWSIRAARRGKN